MTAPTAAKLSSTWDATTNTKQGWPKFLSTAEISGLRGWTGQSIDFNYPVVAIAGANGSGKSTIVKAIAAAHRAPANTASVTYSPDDFFPKTPWEDVKNVILSFTIREGSSTRTTVLKKPTSRWRGLPERRIRSSFFLDISRIQPANTQIGYGKTAQNLISKGERNELPPREKGIVSRILGRTYETAAIDSEGEKQVGVLSHNGSTYSNFHHGAGEDSALDLMYLISQAPQHSLVIIDEIEAALHPSAQRRLITELLEIVRERKLQVIVTTHSPYILEQLPSRARIYIALDRDGNREIMYGISTDFAMDQLDDEQHADLDIYCEDDESATLIDCLIALGEPAIRKRVRITPAGPAHVVAAVGQLASSRKLRKPGLGVVDGDTQATTGCVALPGTAPPERQVILGLDDEAWKEVASRLGVTVGELLDAKDDAILVPDHHAWTRSIARTLGGLTRPSEVWLAMAQVWSNKIVGPAAAKDWCQPIEAAIEGAETPLPA